jgi:putative tricarboxylic transport membrane protein
MNLRSRIAVVAALLAPLGAPAADALKIMIPAAPASAWDTAARELGKAWIASGTLKNIQYENRDGASGTIALAQFVSNAKGDPAALLVGSTDLAAGIAQNRSAVDLSQVTAVARVASDCEVIVAAPGGAASLEELLARFKADPAGFAWGVAGAGGAAYAVAAWIARESGIDAARTKRVVFKGPGEALAAAARGQVAVAVTDFAAAASALKSGVVRGLAVSCASARAGIPSLKERGLNIELVQWRGLFAAPAITKAQRDELIASLERTTQSREWQEALARNGWERSWLAGDAFAASVAAQARQLEGVAAPAVAK